MAKLSMHRLLFLTAALAISLHISSLAEAQVSVASEPAGFTTTSCLGNSDTLVSLSFTRTPEFIGAILSVSGNPANTITVTGAPWIPNQFVYVAGSQPKHYYVLIGSGGATNPKEGHTYAVTGNTANTLTVDTSSDNLSGIGANTQILLIPHWTLATVFPASDANISFTPTTSSATYKTQILVPNESASGINLPYLPAYFFSNNVDSSTNNVGWRVVGDNTADHGDDVLLLDDYFVVRNQNGASTLPLKSIGAVLTKKLTVPLRTSASQAQDNPVGMVRPFGVSLKASGLNPADGSFVTNDQLLLFDNSQASINKAPSFIYYYDTQASIGAGWRLTGDAVTDRGNDVIPSGSAMVVRKASTVGGQTVFWTNSPPLQPFNVVSRKNHGVGVFDINLPIAGNLGIECRAGGPTQVLFTFPAAVTVASASVTTGIGSVSGFTVAGSLVTVNLTGVTNAQRITLSLIGVTDGTSTNDVPVQIGVLAGDTTGNGSVNSSDISQTKAQSGKPVTALNFRADVTSMDPSTAQTFRL